MVIITNAETNWVQLSCQKFMPRLWPLVARLRIVSARSTFEANHPDSPSDWKVQAFFQEICAAYAGTRPNERKNILSFGDSVHERAAVHRVTSGMGPRTRTKSIKFVERPSVEQLKRQVDLVCSCFEEICRHDDHLDLMLTIQLIFSESAAAGGAGGAPAPAPAHQQQQQQQHAATLLHATGGAGAFGDGFSVPATPGPGVVAAAMAAASAAAAARGGAGGAPTFGFD